MYLNHTTIRPATAFVMVLGLAVATATAAAAATLISPATTSTAHVNMYGSCWVRYGGDRASDQAYGYDENNTCSDQVGARMWYQPAGPVGYQTTSIAWAPNYAITISVNDFREAKGYTIH